MLLMLYGVLVNISSAMHCAFHGHNITLKLLLIEVEYRKQHIWEQLSQATKLVIYRHSALSNDVIITEKGIFE